MIDMPSLNKFPNGDYQIYFSSEHVERWKQLGSIPSQFIAVIQISFENAKTPFRLNSHTPLSFDEGRLQARQQRELDQYLIKNWDRLVQALKVEPKKGLFQNMADDSFGVSRFEADPIVRLSDLLSNMQLSQIDENEFQLRGEVSNSRGNAIVLEYTFRDKSLEDAEVFGEKYKIMMKTKGLRAFLSYWKIANDSGGLNFSCSLSAVMSEIASEAKGAYFNDKSRKDFWKITRALSATKFKIEWPSPTRGTKKPRKKWIEQPLLQIHGGEREIGEEIPINLSVTVLTKESAKERFSPACFSKRTLKLAPAEVNFATIIQVRAAQMGNGQRELSFDWQFVIEHSNLGQTARSNPRKAKASVRKRLTTLEQEKIIESSRDDKHRVYVQPYKSVSKNSEGLS